MMDRFDSRLIGDYRKRLTAKINEETERLVTTPAPDHAEYKQRVGLVRGLADALVILQDIQDNLGRDEAVQSEGGSRAANSYES